MFDDKNIVDSIMEHPSAALILQRLQEKLDEEQNPIEYWSKTTQTWTANIP